LDVNRPGALVISLDFELLWGVRDLYPSNGGTYRANVLGARAAIPKMLDLFTDYDVAATWAPVGMLFASSRDELARFSPSVRPHYIDRGLDPYADPGGDSEGADPLRFAPSLLRQIAATPRQEIGSHTFAHYYPLEPGHDAASFRADLDAAVAIGQAFGVRPRSLVIPRNQLDFDYLPIIGEAGFTSVRGNQRGWPHRACPNAEFRRPAARIRRLIDAYLPTTGDQVIAWDDVPVISGVACIPASHFLRPVSARLRRLEPLRFERLRATIERAAQRGGICHLWWHPHNFGVEQTENLAFLRRLLDVQQTCAAKYGMKSLTMEDVAASLSPINLDRATAR